MLCRACLAAEAPSTVLIHVPVVLQNLGQEQEQGFVLGFIHGLVAALLREKGGGNGGGENALPKVTEGNSPGISFPGLSLCFLSLELSF